MPEGKKTDTGVSQVESCGQAKRRMAACFLVGPTAVGKSAVAEYIAARHGYHLLSADSMMVYRGMDVGTAKPGVEVRQNLRYHGLDIVDPDKQFSVWNYREYAASLLSKIPAESRVLVVGGTGLYIKALTDGLDAGVAPDARERAVWMAALESGGIAALQSVLRETDPLVYESVPDKENWRRLIRAFETIRGSGSGNGRGELPSRRWRKGDSAAGRIAGLAMPVEDLNRRIEARVKTMFASGIVEETRRLIAAHGKLSMTAAKAIGYAEAMAFIDGYCTLEEAEARTMARTRQLAKKQRTWFRHQAQVEWIETGAGDDLAAVADKVMESWRRNGPTEIAG